MNSPSETMDAYVAGSGGPLAYINRQFPMLIEAAGAPKEESAPSEDAVALAFVESSGSDYRYVAQSHWLKWDGMR